MTKFVLLFEAFDSQEADDLREVGLMPPKRYQYDFTFMMDGSYYADAQECRNRIYDNLESFQSVIAVLHHDEIDDLTASAEPESPVTSDHIPIQDCHAGFTSLLDQYTMAPLFNKHMGNLVFNDSLEFTVESI
jgi:hypothetical protein